MTSTQINQGNYTAYQPYMLLNFDYSFQNDVLDDDLSVTILEVLGRINLNKFIDFHNLDSRSYDPVMMLTIILMAFAEDGYASLRKLEKLCRYDIRYRSITNGCVPSYKSFERFINHTLKESIQTIAKEIYLYVQDEKALEEQILYIDGTKFEANANKMTFCWKGWSKRYLPRHWQKCMELLKQVNRYFKKHEININPGLFTA
ncbi:MAG: transposase [[Clostridium] innocuum]